MSYEEHKKRIADLLKRLVDSLCVKPSSGDRPSTTQFIQNFNLGENHMKDENKKSAADRLDELVQEKMKAKPELNYSSAFSEVQVENLKLTETYIQELP